MSIVPKVPSLRSIRESHFLTQDELAERARVNVMTISKLERGAHEARLRTIRKLAEALGVEPSALVQESCP
jgi:transcriptional regulator with XRE-family HTH domain